MTGLTCRKSMTPCPTPGMCSPHGGCPATEQVSSAWLAQLRSEYVAFGEQNTALKAENVRLETERAELWRWKRDAVATLDTSAAVVAELKAQRDALSAAMNEILRVTRLHSEAFGIAALVLGELSADVLESKEAPRDE